MAIVIRGIYGTEGVRVEYEYDDADNKANALHYSNLTQRSLRVIGPGGLDWLLPADTVQAVNLAGLQLEYRKTRFILDGTPDEEYDPNNPDHALASVSRERRDPLDQIPFAFAYPGD